MISKISSMDFLDDVTNLLTYAFNKPLRSDSFKTLFHVSDNWANFDQSQLNSLVMAIPFEQTIFGQSMKMAGIGNVASFPEIRGQGSVRLLFHEMLNDLYQQKVALSFLAPFSRTFYEKFGYADAIDQLHFTVNKYSVSQLPMEKNGTLKRVNIKNQADTNTIKELYKITLAKENGSVQRAEWRWEYLFKNYPNRKYTLCYDYNGNVCGYIVYTMENDSFTIIELAYISLFAYKKLMTFISAHAASFNTFKYATSISSQFVDFLPESIEVNQQQSSYMMGRIINLKEFLSYLPTKSVTSKSSLTIGISDSICKGNNGLWQLTFQDNNINCQKLDSDLDKADLITDIGSFTQLCLNYRSIEQLIFSQKIIVNNPKAITLSDYLINAPLQIYDYF